MDLARAGRDYTSMVSTQRPGQDSRPGVMAPGPAGAPREPREPRPRGSFKRCVWRALREPFTRSNWRECLYAGLSLLVAIPLFAFTAIAVTVGIVILGFFPNLIFKVTDPAVTGTVVSGALRTGG